MPRISYRRKLFLKKLLRAMLIVAGIVAVVSIVLLIYFEPFVTYDREGAHLDLSSKGGEAVASTAPGARPVINDAQIIMQEPEANGSSILELSGYYITTAMLQEPEKVRQALETLDSSCAVMIEMKSIYGNFYYSTAIGGASTADVDIAAVDDILSYLRSHGFYMIAEIPAFCDTNFALANQSSGLPLASGALWMDERACYWLDPASETVLSYLTQIARELSSLGFKEVAFSEFRFPTSKNIAYSSEKTSTQLIEDAAGGLTAFFTGSNLTISFVTDATDFPTSACTGRLYIPDVDGTKIEKYVQSYADAGLEELVFLANSRDTRCEQQATLRPLFAN